nr:HAMP domain-containing histidine kinase [Acidobacteriota bacterium]
WRRLLAVGLTLATLTAIVGFAAEWRRFGAEPDGALTRADAELRERFSGMTALLDGVASGIANDRAAAAAVLGGPDAAKALFDVVDTHSRAVVDDADIAVTVFETDGTRVSAWAGRPSDIPVERIRGPRAWFVTPSPLGLRLVHVRPIGPEARPVGVVAVEHPLSPGAAGATIAQAGYVLPTRVGPASLRTQYEGAGDRPRPNTFLVRAPTGETLMEVSISSEQVALARAAWRRGVLAVVLGFIAITVLLLIGPMLDHRSVAETDRRYQASTWICVALLLGGAALVWIALRSGIDGGPDRYTRLLLCGATATALVALFASPAARLRLTFQGRRHVPASAPIRFGAEQLTAGAVVAMLVALFDAVLRWALDGATVDLRHFSLHPWSADRLTLLAAILACNLATLWAGTLVLATALVRWRISRRVSGDSALALAAWVVPACVVAATGSARHWPVPLVGMIASATACAIAALAARRVSAWFRHATVAARILALFVAFLAPSLLLYPSVNFFTDRAVRGVIATKYAVEAQSHPQTLQALLVQARQQIDALPLAEHARDSSAGQSAGPRTDSAFFLWRQTALARARLTSAIELYDASGALVSRFALNFPEYTAATQPTRPIASCQWDVFGEAAPFGSEERRMLHAERSICEGDGRDRRVLGSIVVHVVPDYRTLPFITSESPYFEVFRRDGGAPREGITGHDVDIVIYGWGLTPLYASGAAAWPITDDLFARTYRSREPFWTEVRSGDRRWHVFFSNDRSGIYAIGYPKLTIFDRLVHVAELPTLAATAYVLVLIGSALFTRLSRERARVGRALLREIRASFYRKLFLAFVLASIIPVLTLAVVIRAYFAGLLLADVEAEAARSALVAQRVIEESQALQRQGGQTPPPASDDVMIWISQVIDQDVNIFDGPSLVATSERDLFASGLLPTRTPDDVYRAIALQRLPSFVGEDRIGAITYMIAAAPVRTGGRDAILTVPLANQQREIEREIDEIDRGVHLAALFFILLGAAIGLSMAERIADPVRRLTRATRRIARGDFDERIAVRSSDELRRLVDAFNSMAAELKEQRTQLERTHRLEAWAEMARQVAHEIKNPLTPIQLSAEHLRRVHIDRGEPMGAVLDSCVTSILGQVRLLRQISSEFSNFASSPTARLVEVDLPELVAEVVDPYRTGLAGRITIDNRVPPSLPHVMVDRTLIARALSNIVENALHAMPGDGGLTLTSDTEADAVALHVRDTGGGMDAGALARVFEPYFSTKATGTGLGLPIARRNVELSGGQIDVQSVRGAGTTVTLRLPIARRASPAADLDVGPAS